MKALGRLLRSFALRTALLTAFGVLGISAIGRVTVAVLNMNAAGRVQLRQQLANEGRPEIG